MTTVTVINLHDEDLTQLAAGNPVTVNALPARVVVDPRTGDATDVKRLISTNPDGDLFRFPVTFYRYDLTCENPDGYSIRLDKGRVAHLSGNEGAAKDVTLFLNGDDSGLTAWLLGPRWDGPESSSGGRFVAVDAR